ncbi:MAG TPA: hypothetical protein VF507_08530 [Pyrinomonadaceae bacterium]|jgi:type IV secretory pathway VirB10-like protein
MEDRRKINIPLGAEQQVEPDAPKFDAEETVVAARRVEPLQAGVSAPGQVVYAPAPMVAAPPPRAGFPWWLLALVVLAAMSVGAAAALALNFYRNQRPQSAQSGAQPPRATASPTPEVRPSPAESTSPKSTESPTHNSNNSPAEQPSPKEQERASESPAQKTEAPTPAAERATAREPSEPKPKKSEETAAAEERKREKERRKREREGENEPNEAERQVNRANKEVQRIREIFEGKKPDQ